jgi:hypothetical protein
MRRKRHDNRRQPNFDRMLREFKRDVRNKQYHVTKSEKKQIKMNAAKRRAAKLQQQNSLPPRRPHGKYPF